ncbi:MAG: hypothetical protein NTU98_10055 [Bacteroidetes bacterium]|nr:hypothetical protein [Bacteroidota bacterium]
MSKKNNTKENATIGEKILRFPLVYLVIFFVIFLVYGRILFFSLGKLDETNIILNNIGFLTDFGNLKEAFLTNPFFNKGGDFYRPLQNLSFMIDAHLSGQNGWAYYLSNILIHFVTCSLIFYLLNLFGKNSRMALLLTLIFAVHPLFVQTVAWAPSRGDMFLALFGIASFIFFIRYIRSGNYWFLALNILFFALAQFSKEAAVIIPVICLLWYLAFENEKKVSYIGLIIPALFSVAFFLLFMYIRNDVVKIVVPEGQFGFLPFLVHLRTIPEFILKFFLPVGLGPMPAFSLVITILGIVLFGLLIWISVRYNSGSGKIFLFGLAWFLLFVTPQIMYINKFGSSACDYMEHRAYLPLVGIMLFLFTLLTRAPKIKENKTLPVILLLIIPVFGAYTYIYSGNYRTPMSYYDLSVENNPASAVGFFNRGAVRMNFENDFTGAIKDYNLSLGLFPEYPEAYINRGFAREMLNDTLGALGDYEKAARLKADWFEPHVDLATIKRKMGLHQDAIREYDTVLSLNPMFYQGYTERGFLKTEVNDFKGALEDLNKSIAMHENNPQAFYNRGLLALKLQEDNRAMEDFNRAIQLDGKYTDALINRGVLRYKLQDFQGSIEDFDKVISLSDRYAEAYLDRGMAKYMAKDLPGACDDWRTAQKLGFPEAERLLELYCSK